MDHLRSLAQPSARFAGDVGAADPLVRQALAAANTQSGYVRALVALCTARLLLPVVASGDETAHQDPDRHGELAAVTLIEQGVTHLLAFTGLDSLQAWQREARPVPCLLDELAASVEPAGATRLLVDVAGPASLVVGEEVVAELAQGRRLVEFEDGGFAWASGG